MSNEGDMSENDKKFFQDLEAQFEGAAPGVSERLEKLNSEQLGRSIVIMSTEEEIRARVERITPSMQDHISSEAEGVPQKSKNFLIGYILPVQKNQEKHVVILRNGSILVTQPMEGNERAKKEFSPNPNPLYLGHDYLEIGMIEEFFLNYNYKILLSNNNPQDIPQIEEAIKLSLNLARELKASREKARRESIGSLNGQLDSLFRKK